MTSAFPQTWLVVKVPRFRALLVARQREVRLGGRGTAAGSHRKPWCGDVYVAVDSYAIEELRVAPSRYD